MKKTLSVLLSVVLLLGAIPGAIAFAAPGAKLYNVYADGIIFEQNSDAVFAGIASPGASVKAVLRDSSGAETAEGESVAGEDGTFTVSFPSPAGSFTEYTVELSADGTPFQTLSNVVFGEVWLSSGQSNMSYPYSQAEDYVAPADAASDEKSFIRLFKCPELVEYNGSVNNLPAEPQNEIPGCEWFDANDPRCDGFSAVSYFFALDLAKTLDVPLGVVALPLGASSILSWLSRETIDSSALVTARAKENGEYYSLEDWNDNGIAFGESGGPSNYFTMTAQYNKKTYAVRNFRFSGMIWYQGETDMYWDDAEYAEALDLMQDSYSELFAYDGTLPFIWTQLAAYYYSNNENNTLRNIAFADMQQSRPDSRALVTSYDYPATYNDAGPIHPQSKKPVGERMSFAAQRLVYGGDGDYTLPTVESYEIADGGISVTFRDTGDGLICDGAHLRGFSIAGENGVYVRAEAEITGADTVFIRSDEVPQPVSAAYAFAITSDTANLYASENSEKTLPVSPFMLDRESDRVSYQNNTWTECEEDRIWHEVSNSGSSAFYDAWTARGANASIAPDAAYEGEAGLRINGDGCFSVSPTTATKDGLKNVVLSDINDDWRDYSSLSVMLRNDGDSDVMLEDLRIQTAWFFIRVPVVAGTQDSTYILPADGQWHKVTFDLGTVYAGESPVGPQLDGSASLEYITGVTFRFSGSDADICLDDVRFTPREGEKSDDSLSTFKNVLLWLITPLKTLTRLIERLKEIVRYAVG